MSSSKGNSLYQPPKSIAKRPLFEQLLLELCWQSQFEKLSKLHLDNIELSNQNLWVLNNTISELKSLRVLSVTNCGLTDGGLQLMQKGIQNSCLNSLDLTANRLAAPKTINQILTFQSFRYALLLLLYFKLYF